MEVFTELVIRLLGEKHMSGRELARVVHYDPGGMTRIINGERRCPPKLAAAIDGALDADGAVKAAAAAAPERPPDAEKTRRALDDALADGMMPSTMLDDWDTTIARYGYRTRDTPAPLLLSGLTADLSDLRLAFGRHRSASALPRLALAAAHMTGLVCLTLIKAGDSRAWRRWGRTSRHAASEAGDGPALSWATAQEAYGYYYAGDMQGAVAVARAAVTATRSACVGGVLAAALEMRAHAAMGDASAAMNALATAEEIHARLPAADLAPSAFGYAESQLRFHSGDMLTRLGDTTAARQVLDHALELCPPEDYTDWALIRLNQAACVARDGDPASGLAYATETLTRLDGPKRQGVITTRGRELLAALTPAQQATRAATAFRDLLDDTSGMKELLA